MEFFKFQNTLFSESLGNQFRVCKVHCTLSIKQLLVLYIVTLLEYNSSIQTITSLWVQEKCGVTICYISKCVRFCLLTVSEFNVCLGLSSMCLYFACLSYFLNVWSFSTVILFLMCSKCSAAGSEEVNLIYEGAFPQYFFLVFSKNHCKIKCIWIVCNLYFSRR